MQERLTRHLVLTKEPSSVFSFTAPTAVVSHSCVRMPTDPSAWMLRTQTPRGWAPSPATCTLQASATVLRPCCGGPARMRRPPRAGFGESARGD